MSFAHANEHTKIRAPKEDASTSGLSFIPILGRMKLYHLMPLLL